MYSSSSSSRRPSATTPRAPRTRLDWTYQPSFDGNHLALPRGSRSPPPQRRLSRSSSEESVTIGGARSEREGIPPRRIHRLRRVTTRSFPPPVTATASTPPYAPSSPDPIGLIDIPAPRSSSQPQSPTPRRIHQRIDYRRSQSPSYSPSRTRYISLSVPPLSAVEPSTAAVSPPHSPSRVWLEEYAQHQAVPAYRPSGSRQDYHHPSYTYGEDVWADLEGLERPPQRRRRDEDVLDEERAAIRRRHRYIAEAGEREERRHMQRYADAPQHRNEARQRDTRRDGVVFDAFSPPLPSSAISGNHLGGGLFGSDSHLPEPGILPSRHDVLPERDSSSFIDFDFQPRPVPVYPSDAWEEAEGGSGGMSSYPYII